uniref:Uncharacterized protein n=1 Tax=Anguilla anguilla TaxID=7936 RepID=A0A0E9RNF7_ANGAN
MKMLCIISAQQCSSVHYNMTSSLQYAAPALRRRGDPDIGVVP